MAIEGLILKLPFSKPFWNNYAFTANILEVMKLSNLGDRIFEIDFNYSQITRMPSLKTFRFHLLQH